MNNHDERLESETPDSTASAGPKTAVVAESAGSREQPGRSRTFSLAQMLVDTGMLTN